MPDAAAKLLDLLAVKKHQFADLGQRLPSGTALPEPQPVFPRYLEAEA
jgi:methionyl-tRNA synthetase